VFVRCCRSGRLSRLVSRRGIPPQPRRLTLGACLLAAALLALTGTPASAATPGGHGHDLSLPVTIGPIALRIVLLSVVPAVAGFALMRAFLPEPGRGTVALVTAGAAVTVLLELMLADGLDIPSQTAVLVLAALAVPVLLAASRDPRAVSARAHARRFAPWVLSVTAGLAMVEFGRAWLGRGEPGAMAVPLHTGLVLAFVGLSWFALGLPRSRMARVIVQVEAAVLAAAVVAGAAHATVLRPPESSTPGAVVVDDGPGRFGDRAG
jgi:hypothetical protein